MQLGGAFRFPEPVRSPEGLGSGFNTLKQPGVDNASVTAAVPLGVSPIVPVADTAYDSAAPS